MQDLFVKIQPFCREKCRKISAVVPQERRAVMALLEGKEYRLWQPMISPEEIAQTLGVQNSGDFPVGYFSDERKLVARMEAYDRLIVSDERPDLQEKAREFADELTAEDLAAEVVEL
ncbi:MAG: hypothetical protein A2Y57_02405 [Candidatus Woykebacteria bacterium RBG_13_40_7b]|uniref:Uncharacterized protein n=1 Tax=Candidatus Woykebacteria bacterium RBG_13_40_7b TaxID=1802594 RepID=A0A1G1WB99_9BACT|nr:MAG: hypothetical protein A2Y57_02405 [Candidatus Woykebacteria bacterium RBG_13_40_7b]